MADCTTQIRFVRANSDKPHRCPECHRITDHAHLSGRARWWRTYTCSACRLRWWIGWSDDTAFTWRYGLTRLLRKVQR